MKCIITNTMTFRMKLDQIFAQAMVGYSDIELIAKQFNKPWAFNCASLEKVGGTLPIGQNSYAFNISHAKDQMSTEDCNLIAKIFAIEKEFCHFLLAMAVMKLEMPLKDKDTQKTTVEWREIYPLIKTEKALTDSCVSKIINIISENDSFFERFGDYILLYRIINIVFRRHTVSIKDQSYRDNVSNK